MVWLLFIVGSFSGGDQDSLGEGTQPPKASTSITEDDIVTEVDYSNLNRTRGDSPSTSEYYGIIPAEEFVLIRTYSDDTDDILLAELKPRFIVMYEPHHEFIRRIEVCDFSFIRKEADYLRCIDRLIRG